MIRVLAVLALLTPVAPVAATPLCAWPEEVAADAHNVALPDTNARYWVMPYEVLPLREITVTGSYPDSRYLSFTVYAGQQGPFTSNGVSSARTDFAIEPDPGSVNPWQQAAAPGGSYTLNLKMGVDPAETNVLPLAPADAERGQTGFLIYRTYLADGDTATPLPTLTITDRGRSTTLPPCRRVSTPVVPSSAAAAGDPVFSRPEPHEELFPNPDSGYLTAWVTPPAATDVVVLRGKAPVAAGGHDPRPWPRLADDLRYWSLCANLRDPNFPVVVNQLPGGVTDPGCRHDDLVALDDDGWYTFAVGTEDQRPAIEAIPGVTFVPFSLDHPNEEHLLVLRNMLPVAGFAEAIENVPATGDPAAAAAIMGDYYPHAQVCALTDVSAAGC